MKKQLLFIFHGAILMGLMGLASCSNDGELPFPPQVSSVMVEDVSDFGDGRDLQVSFNKALEENLITEYRIVIAKASSSFTEVHANALAADRFKSLPIANSNYVVTLDQTSKDTDGDLIQEGQAYLAFVLSVGKSGKNSLSKSSGEVTLTLPATPGVSGVSISDVSNFGDGRDLRVTFGKVTNEQLITEYRIIVVKASSVGTFTTSVAESLHPDLYTIESKTGSDKAITLSQSTRDSEGDLIVQDRQYGVFVLTLGNGRNTGKNKLSVVSNIITIEIPSAPVATLLMALDVANNATAKDIELHFNKGSNESFISSYRAIVVKESGSSNFTVADAENLALNRYLTINKSGANQRVELTGSMLDSDGDVITESVPYKLFVLSMADGTIAGKNSLSSGSGTLTLERKNTVRTFAQFANAGTGGLSVDASGNVYFGNFGLTDNGGGAELYKITASGASSLFANGLSTADGSDFDSQGNLYVVSWPNTIYKITPTGTKSVFANNFQINIPIGIVVDNQDNLLVTCFNGNNVVKITQAGVVSVFSSSGIYNGPNGIDMDAAGNFYVSNWNDGSVIKVNKDSGSAELFVTLPSPQKAHLAIHNDNIYVAGRWVHTIYKISMNKTVTTFLGTGSRGDLNGSLSSATISWPNDIAFNADGSKMYISMVGLASTGQNIISPTVIREVSIVE